MTRRIAIVGLACAAVLLGPSGRAKGAGFAEVTRASEKAVRAGLARLASMQADDGSFGSGRYGRNVAITSLAALAMMADGHLPGRGRYGAHVARAVDFVLDHAQETGLLAADTSHGPMYSHGFGALLLGEVYGMTGDPRRRRRVREALYKAVRLIVDTQNGEGGWRYHPAPRDADISVTICQVMALRAARNAGITVPAETIERAIAYVRKCQDDGTGGFRYMIGSGGPAFPRSAAGVASLYYAGVYRGESIERGLGFLMKYLPGEGQEVNSHYYYGQYYAVQAMFLAGGEHWRRWFPAIREQLIARQKDDGRWSASAGDAYGTAMALIVLQVPNRYLPIFQR